jgi:hypothetical protein
MIIGIEALVANMIGGRAVESFAELAPAALLGCAALGLVVSWSRSSPRSDAKGVPLHANPASGRRRQERGFRTGVQAATLPWPPS